MILEAAGVASSDIFLNLRQHILLLRHMIKTRCMTLRSHLTLRNLTIVFVSLHLQQLRLIKVLSFNERLPKQAQGHQDAAQRLNEAADHEVRKEDPVVVVVFEDFATLAKV